MWDKHKEKDVKQEETKTSDQDPKSGESRAGQTSNGSEGPKGGTAAEMTLDSVKTKN